MSSYGSSNVPCPSDSWEAYESGQEGPEGLCANCLCTLPEEDPDPKNTGVSPWWEGFCSEECRKGEPVPTDEHQLKELNAYGHQTYTVGFSDEWSDHKTLCDCSWQPKETFGFKIRRFFKRLVRNRRPVMGERCAVCGNREDRGDWLACFDGIVWKHPSRGVLVAYHVVVNSDSGGFTDTLESGVVEAEKAPFDLPDYWTSIGMDHGIPWTEEECRKANDCQERWESNLRQEIEAAQGEQA